MTVSTGRCLRHCLRAQQILARHIHQLKRTQRAVVPRQGVGASPRPTELRQQLRSFRGHFGPPFLKLPPRIGLHLFSYLPSHRRREPGPAGRMGGPQHLIEELRGRGAGFGTDFHQAAEHPVVRLKPAPDTVDRLPGRPERKRLLQGSVDVMAHGMA